MRQRDINRQREHRKAQNAAARAVHEAALPWVGLSQDVARLKARTNWESQVAHVCLGSSAQRLTDETAEQFNGRCKAHKEAGKNPNRLKPFKATGVTTWERNRNNQRKAKEYGELNAPVYVKPRPEPGKRENPRCSSTLGQFGQEILNLPPVVRRNFDGIPAGHIKAKKRA